MSVISQRYENLCYIKAKRWNFLTFSIFQLIDTLFLLFNALSFFESGLFKILGSLFNMLFVLFDPLTQGALCLFVGLVFEDDFELQQTFFDNVPVSMQDFLN